MRLLKLATLLTVIGGVGSDGQRGNCHMMMVGDPGTGKSVMLRQAAQLSERSVLTTGVGTTKAGLTAAAVRDGRHWSFEAGALVLADGGVCCIDEFNSMGKEDRGGVHEAMEQQCIHLAKAGMVAKLRTRTTVLAALNARGTGFRADIDLSSNTGLGTPLLSRFDLVFLVLDRRDPVWDAQVAAQMLHGFPRASDEENANDPLRGVTLTEDRQCRVAARMSTQWSLRRLGAYVDFVRAQFKPALTPMASEILRRVYVRQRSSSAQMQLATTVRFLEGLVRLAQAHARLMFRRKCTALDALVVAQLARHSMHNMPLQAVNDLMIGADLRAAFMTSEFHEAPGAADREFHEVYRDELLQELFSEVELRELSDEIGPRGSEWAYDYPTELRVEFPLMFNEEDADEDSDDDSSKQQSQESPTEATDENRRTQNVVSVTQKQLQQQRPKQSNSPFTARKRPRPITAEHSVGINDDVLDGFDFDDDDEFSVDVSSTVKAAAATKNHSARKKNTVTFSADTKGGADVITRSNTNRNHTGDQKTQLPMPSQFDFDSDDSEELDF
ncbi:MAG: hypothetical protein MHM6MM_008474 [Cercozoa sp. M6MM]